MFQPAEELLEGAKLVCQSGVLDGTDYILGQHAVLDVDVGQVQVCYGPSNGGGDEFTLRLHGVGCHVHVRTPVKILFYSLQKLSRDFNKLLAVSWIH